MQRILIKDSKGHTLPYKFWLVAMFEDYLLLVQVWSLKTTKDIIGTVEHMALPVSIGSVDNPLQRARNALAEKNVAMIAAQANHEAERVMLLAQIDSLQAKLA
ncbi:hypothetical protein FXO37_30594 [Capsicum annuum]|nr:hypothetical protein FXO37_30594 [Capsicum annuum]